MSTAKRYIVTVTAPSAEQADQVMAERLSHDEDYGFDYEVDFVQIKLDPEDDSWPYFEAYLGTKAQPQAVNVWGWGSHAEARAAMCEFLGEPISEVVDELAGTQLCVDYDSAGIDKGERSTVLTIRKALSVSGANHPILAETTTRLRRPA